MNNDQFELLYDLALRYVTAIEADVEQTQREWLEVQKEVERRKEILAKLRQLAPGETFPDDAEIVDLGNLFDEEDDDEDSGA